MNTTRDYVGQWFEIYESLKEPANILIDLESNERASHIEFSHIKGDGAAALFSLAEKYGWHLSYVNRNLKKPPPISRVKYFLNCLRFLYWTKPRSKNIWPFNFGKSQNTNTPNTKLKFTPEQTQQIFLKAKALNVSLNTFLFYHLNLTFEKKYHLKKRSWWIPVNMRADLGLNPNDQSLKTNLVSNFTIDITPEMKLQDYQELISLSLKQQKHWATWWWQHLGRYIPHQLVKLIAIRNLYQNHYVGTFTNLGEWTCSDKTSSLTVLANPILSHPIGASAIIWNNELHLGIRFYPTFPITAGEIQELILDWGQRLI